MDRDDDTSPTVSVNPAFVPIVVDENEVHFRTGPWSGPTYRIRDRDEDGDLEGLLEAIDGERSIDDVCERFEDSESVRETVESLVDRNVLVTGRRGDAGLGQGYASLRTDAEGESTEDARVLVVTDGTLGRYVVEDVVAAGVDEVCVLLPESIDASEWTNSLDVAAASDVTVLEGGGEMDGEAATADVLVAAFTGPRPRLLEEVNAVAHSTGTPLLVGQVRGFDGVVGPTVLPGETACVECFRRRRDAVISDPDVFSKYERRAEAAGTERRAARPMVRIVAGHLSYDVRNQLGGDFAFTAGRVLHHDFYEYTVESNDVLRLPDCEVCGSSAGHVDDARHDTVEHIVERTNDERGRSGMDR
jgi:bacteriocin biosynthesis cyclodehydratase domain-containing protein